LQPELVLASRSPQRRAILEQLGVAFTTASPDIEEATEGDPRELVMANALAKARAVAAGYVLGADTAVSLDGRVFGKPSDASEAESFLRTLSGREHEVWTGVALKTGAEERVDAACTSVRFRSLDDALLAWYLASGEWRERAGGYAIQGRGAALVDSIAGDYFNVVGLPVALLARMAPDLLR
jgi:septum formation protein